MCRTTAIVSLRNGTHWPGRFLKVCVDAAGGCRLLQRNLRMDFVQGPARFESTTFDWALCGSVWFSTEVILSNITCWIPMTGAGRYQWMKMTMTEGGQNLDRLIDGRSPVQDASDGRGGTELVIVHPLLRHLIQKVLEPWPGPRYGTIPSCFS